MNTLYHYCSTDSFYKILETRTLRLSSLTASNDYMEGKLVSQAVARIARADNLSSGDTAVMQDAIAMLELASDGQGFCLSETGDLLSQWRGYASDGMGIAVGFRKDFLERVAHENTCSTSDVQLTKVEYDPTVHDDLVRPVFVEMKQLLASRASPPTILGGATPKALETYRNEALKINMKVMTTPLKFLLKVFRLKAQGFAEEREWRLLSHSVPTTETAPEYRPALDRLIPYISLPFGEHNVQPIEEIVLGPKHKTPRLIAEQFLAHKGYENVRVVESRTSYR